jgi:hypothetical protein
MAGVFAGEAALVAGASSGIGRAVARRPAEEGVVGGEVNMANQFPPGWDEERVRRVLAYYEAQSDDEASAEDKTGSEGDRYTLMEVPVQLVPVIRCLIAQYETGAEMSVGGS